MATGNAILFVIAVTLVLAVLVAVAITIRTAPWLDALQRADGIMRLLGR